MSKERVISSAREKISGGIYDVETHLDTYDKAFKIRHGYNNGDYNFECLCCEQKLIISSSKNGLIHFKHAKGTSYCELKNENYSTDDANDICKHLSSKESARHFELKNVIGLKLKKDFEISNIFIDNKFIIEGNDRGKPDVHCEFKKKKIVFEIQLSKLPLRYILKRHNFYKSSGYYLIWILDDFDVRGQSQMEKDIKYLTPSENFFKLDETSELFNLSCKYKFPYLVNDTKIVSSWKTKSIGLRQLFFNEGNKEVYFFNYRKEVELLERKRKEIKTKKVAERIQREEKERRESAQNIALNIIEEIKEKKENKYSNYQDIEQRLFSLDDYEIEVFNKTLDLKKRDGNPAIFRWLINAKKSDIHFIHFLLNCQEIKFDVNEKNDKGESLMGSLLENTSLEAKQYLIQPLLKRGYVINSNDKQIIKEYYKNKADIEKLILQCEMSLKLDDSFYVVDIFKYINLLSIVASLERGIIIGFGFESNAWIQFANNAIQNHTQHWKYIRKAMEHYNVWDLILKLDKKKSFIKKLEQLKQNPVNPDYECEYILFQLYPEVYYEMITEKED